MRRSSTLLTLLALLLLAAAVTAHAAVKPKAGPYQGTVDGTQNTYGHNEGEGYLKFNGSRLVPYKGIFTAPSYFKCNAVNANIPVKSIPVKAGAFDWKGKAPIGPRGANRILHFKGHWVSSTKIIGTTNVSGGGCNKTVRWTMKTPLPPYSA
jgi:hypothetical protein